MITPIYATIIGILFFVLSARVITYRRANSISLGDGDDKTMRRRIRAQANCAEYAPIILLLMLMYEMQAGQVVALHGVGVLLCAGRILHGIALSGAGQWIVGRIGGMVMTLFALLGAILLNLVTVLF